MGSANMAHACSYVVFVILDTFVISKFLLSICDEALVELQLLVGSFCSEFARCFSDTLRFEMAIFCCSTLRGRFFIQLGPKK